MKPKYRAAPTKPFAISSVQSSPVLPIGAFPQVGQEDVLPIAIDVGLPRTERVVPHLTIGERNAASKAAPFSEPRMVLLCGWLSRASTTDLSGVNVSSSAAAATTPRIPVMRPNL